MSTVTAPVANGANVPVPALPFDQRAVRFTPLAESEAIEISVNMVKNILAVRSKSGKEPQPADIMKYMMLCKSRKLNPFVGDAYLLGYDSKDGTKWNLITAIQALRKRAEANPKYRGTECGVIVRGADNTRIEREGAMVDDGEKLLGGWAKVHREDRSMPTYASVKLSVYDTGMSRWGKDPGGMISKVAEAAALRQAFPSDLAGLYIRDEFDGGIAENVPAAVGGMAGLKNRLQAHEGEMPAPAPRESRRDTGDVSDETDQRVSEVDDANQGASPDQGVQVEPAGNPASASPEELAEQEQATKGRKGKQSSLIDTGDQHQ